MAEIKPHRRSQKQWPSGSAVRALPWSDIRRRYPADGNDTAGEHQESLSLRCCGSESHVDAGGSSRY